MVHFEGGKRVCESGNCYYIIGTTQECETHILTSVLRVNRLCLSLIMTETLGEPD